MLELIFLRMIQIKDFDYSNAFLSLFLGLNVPLRQNPWPRFGPLSDQV